MKKNLIFLTLFQAKSEEELSKEKSWLDAEKLWLIHRGGFTAVRRLQNSENEPGKIRVCLEETEDILNVDEDDIEKANPPQFDRVEDLSQLRYLNESSVLHTLRQRYATNLIHTYAGSNMIIINPMAPLAIYSDKVSKKSSFSLDSLLFSILGPASA